MLNRSNLPSLCVLAFCCLLFQIALLAWDTTPPSVEPAPIQSYRLGAGDQIVISAFEVDEISNKPMRLDNDGQIRLPVVGTVHAAGLTVDQLEQELTKRLGRYVKQPKVAVQVVDFHSQPVSVLGAVRNPGVQQLQGSKNLIEVLSLAGGLREDAGYSALITRKMENGALPLPHSQPDATNRFSLTKVDLTNVLDGTQPANNIFIQADDVITVPRAELIYVLGEVHKAGGFVLRDRESLSALTALSLAEGLVHTAAPQNARILRASSGSATRTEVPVNLKKILDGKEKDINMQAGDILIVPNSLAKNAAMRGLESAIQIGTGIIIWRR